MPEIRSFEDLQAWQAARELVFQVYAVCRQPKLARDYSLVDQIRRASVSVMSNLAEGWESLHLAEKRQVYNYAQRSCGEVRSLSYVLVDNSYIELSQQEILLQLCHRAGQLISGLIRSLDRKVASADNS